MKPFVHTKTMGQRILFFDSLDSTNTEAIRQAVSGGEHGLLVMAGKQESGKGRRGRGWDSPPGLNIYMTLLLRPSFAVDKASMITLVMAVSAARAIRQETGLEALIKWPNDIVVNGKKAVGILTEMQLEKDRIGYIVCGVGINVNQEKFPTELQKTATSLFLEGNRTVSCEKLTARIMEYFERDYEVFCKTEDMSQLMPVYNKLLVNLDAGVRVLDAKQEYSGISKGINEEGELLVEKQDGTVEAVYAGEVSVRGIYGYV